MPPDDPAATARLHDLAVLSVGVAGIGPVLEALLDAAVQLAAADFGNIQLVDADTGDLRIAAQRGFTPQWVAFWDRVARGQGVCGTALQAGARVVVEDVATSPIFADPALRDVQAAAGVRAVQSTPLLTREGRPVGMISTHWRRPTRPSAQVLAVLDLLARQAADIVEQAATTAALRRSEERLRALVTASAEAVFCWSPDGTRMRFLHGRGPLAPACADTGQWMAAWLLPEDLPGIRAAMREALASRSKFDLEHRVRRADGSIAWVRTRAVPLAGADGELLEWVGASADVTARRASADRLFEERQRLDALLRSLPVGVAFSSDAEARHVTGNPALLAFLGAGPADNVSASAPDRHAFGRRAVYLQDGQPVDAEQLPLQRAARGGAPVPPTELVLRLPDGRERPVQVTAAPIRGVDGRSLGGLAVVMDLTDRNDAARAREEARLKDEFIALLGHELRNPLAAIASALAMLPPASAAEAAHEPLEVIARQVGVLRRLVDDLLDVSRVARGQVVLQRGPVALGELLADAASAARGAVDARAQVLEVRAPDRPVVFLGDGVRLAQVLANLLDNASKYSAPRGRIALSAAVEGAEVVLRCRDDGRGVPAAMQERIFESLVRVEAPGRAAQAGLGLGLALVRRLVGLHGGSVAVHSDGPDRGSEFVVRLPFEPAPAPAPGPLGVPPPGPRTARRIVLVEDDPDVSHAVAGALARAGHQVTCFPDGASALNGTPDLAPDAVLLDIALPDMDGSALLAALRASPRLSDTRFIALSGPLADTRAPARRAGFDDDVVEPADVDALLARIAPAERPRPAPRVLLVEDHRDLARATAALLRREGLEVTVAADGRDALAVGPGLQPRLVLCDLNLPDMTGWDVVRALRARAAPGECRYAIVTALSPAAVQALGERAAAAGIDEVIAKPLTPDRLHALAAALRAP